MQAYKIMHSINIKTELTPTFMFQASAAAIAQLSASKIHAKVIAIAFFIS
jgi:hypothetical protein